MPIFPGLYTDTRSSKFESLQKDGDENDLDHDFLFSNASHRQIVSAGVAGGLAAAFGAPIGGVLFALEEACSVWSRKTAWRCLLCTATAVFTLSQLWPNASGTGILSLSGTYPLSSRQWLRQLPFVAVVAAIGGILGAAFNLMRRGMQRLRAARRRHGLRLLEAAAAAAITVGVVMAASAKYGMCLQVPPTWPPEQLLRVQCPEGQYNDLATTLLASAPFVIRGLLGLGSENEPINELCTLKTPCYFSPQALGITCIIYLMLMVLSSGLAVPGGLFMPSIMVGGTFGAMAGVVLTPVLPPSWDVQPGVYAMVGATATLSAVFRSNLSLVVIMVEGTGGLEYLPGILIAVLVSNFIAHWVHPDGVYESELERDGRVFFLRQEPPSALRGQIAEDIMAAPVVGLRRIEDVSRVIDVLCSTAHNGFPVHPTSALGAGAPENPARTMQLEGFILRSQLLVLLQERAFCDERGQYIDPHASPAAFEAKLDALMHAAAASSDGIVDATELGVDPLGTIGSGSEDGMTQAFIQTMETLETLRDMPTFAQLLHDDAGDGSQRLSPVSNVPDLYINLTPFMEKGMLAVRPDTPAMSVHQIFVAMSLRHLCVIDEATCVMGIITRKDLDNAAGHGWWRTNKIAPEPSREGMMGPPPSSSWLASSFQSLVVPPRRVLSDIVQRLSPSPRNASILADSDGSAHSERAALPVSAPANGTNDIEARHTPFGSHAC